MRVFVAIDLPDRVRDELEDLQSDLPIGTPTPPENLHLTLCFLGEQHGEAIEAAHDALASIRRPAFELHLTGVGTFGSRSPTVVFAEVAKSDALRDLEKTVVRSLRHAGLEFQKQRFRPHVTLARLPRHIRPQDLDRLRDFLEDNATYRGPRFRVDAFHLYRSTLLPDAARHDVLASYPLTAEP